LLVAGCKDDGINEPKNEYQNPLVGEWYSFWTSEAEGIKVTFTNSTVTAFYYHLDADGLTYHIQKWYDEAPYLFENDTLKLVDRVVWHEPLQEFVPLEHKVLIFTKNTMRIQHFWLGITDAGWPISFLAVDLYRSYK